MRFAVIMAGGSGERFWPLSRKIRPKQLLRLTDPNKTMLCEAVDRVEPLVGYDQVIIATAPHLTESISQANLVDPQNVFAEPSKRNTLGCLVWATSTLLARYGEGVRESSMAILTADHLIRPADLFRKDVEFALGIAERSGGLVTIGIPPRRPETGYGYIEVESVEITGSKVVSFREKPNFQTAREFVDSGKFYWNSGMFFWTIDAFLNELAHTSPASVTVCHAIADALQAGNMELAVSEFDKLENKSIDYALMEGAKQVYMVPARFAWDDVGSFDALIRTLQQDEKGNVVVGNVVATDVNNCVLYNESESKVLTAVGIRDHIVVQTDDAVLMAPLSDAQRVKEIVGMLQGSSFV